MECRSWIGGSICKSVEILSKGVELLSKGVEPICNGVEPICKGVEPMSNSIGREWGSPTTDCILPT